MSSLGVTCGPVSLSQELAALVSEEALEGTTLEGNCGERSEVYEETQPHYVLTQH